MTILDYNKTMFDGQNHVSFSGHQKGGIYMGNKNDIYSFGYDDFTIRYIKYILNYFSSSIIFSKIILILYSFLFKCMPIENITNKETD